MKLTDKLSRDNGGSFQVRMTTTAKRTLSKNDISCYCLNFADTPKSFGTESVNQFSRNEAGMNDVDVWREYFRYLASGACVL